MDGLKFVHIHGDLSPEDKKTIVEGMLVYHANKGHPRKTETYAVVLKDNQDKLLGCVTVSFLWNGMHIDTLWVDESIRGKGYGTKLIEAAEKEGLKRGCTIAYTDTFTWQAPEFYKQLGYKEYGKLENFPEGNSLHYYYKNLLNSDPKWLERLRKVFKMKSSK